MVKEQDISLNNVNLNKLNQHFASPAVLFDSNVKAKTINLSSLAITQCQPFNFRHVADSDVKAISSNTSNSMGIKGISRYTVIPILYIISPIITHTFNQSLTSGNFLA